MSVAFSNSFVGNNEISRLGESSSCLVEQRLAQSYIILGRAGSSHLCSCICNHSRLHQLGFVKQRFHSHQRAWPRLFSLVYSRPRFQYSNAGLWHVEYFSMFAFNFLYFFYILFIYYCYFHSPCISKRSYLYPNFHNFLSLFFFSVSLKLQTFLSTTYSLHSVITSHNLSQICCCL